ncbi:MAG: nucleotidyltransferase, partial [Oscillospiraceae bacterium]|nr:nucleotidyltransferase [Oscillospiraceae bacterium]
LAANEKGRAYLRKLKETPIPVVTKPAAINSMGTDAKEVFACGAYAHDLFRLQFVTNSDKKAGEDWRKGPVIV